MDDKTKTLNPSNSAGVLPFVATYQIKVVDNTPGAIVVEAPYIEALSTPPGLFPASSVGTVGDVAAVSACHSLLPEGWGTATLDFTVKMTGPARGEKLVARARVLQNGRTFSVGAADVYSVSDGVETLCGTVLSSCRNYQFK